MIDYTELTDLTIDYMGHSIVITASSLESMHKDGSMERVREDILATLMGRDDGDESPLVKYMEAVIGGVAGVAADAVPKQVMLAAAGRLLDVRHVDRDDDGEEWNPAKPQKIEYLYLDQTITVYLGSVQEIDEQGYITQFQSDRFVGAGRLQKIRNGPACRRLFERVCVGVEGFANLDSATPEGIRDAVRDSDDDADKVRADALKAVPFIFQEAVATSLTTAQVGMSPLNDLSMVGK